MTLAYRSAAKRRVLLASDRTDRSDDLIAILTQAGEVERMTTEQMPDNPDRYAGVVIDIDLTSVPSVQTVRRKLTGEAYRGVPRLFVLSDSLHREATQAWSLGATDTIRWPFDPKTILQRLALSFPQTEEETSASIALSEGVAAAQQLMIRMFERLPAGVPLSFDDIVRAEGKILRALRRSNLREWLIAINKHHVRSGRHTLFVTGYAVAFAQHLGMRDEDQRRLARAALVHDIGKTSIPLAILDKPEALTAEEEAELARHVQIGHDMLKARGDFPPEMLDVVLHHHELLDGTGYPHQLSGDQISDIVRMITIIDIFAMLVEDRADSPPMSHHDAIAAMERMRTQIDQPLLQAFRPVALAS
jgi:putative nucleotidyltransferase with HDIG domain